MKLATNKTFKIFTVLDHTSETLKFDYTSLDGALEMFKELLTTFEVDPENLELLELHHDEHGNIIDSIKHF